MIKFYVCLISAVFGMREDAGRFKVTHNSDHKNYEVTLLQPMEDVQQLGIFHWESGWQSAVISMQDKIEKEKAFGPDVLSFLKKEFKTPLFGSGDPVRAERAEHVTIWLTKMLTMAVNPTSNQDSDIMMSTLSAFLRELLSDPKIFIRTRRFKEVEEELQADKRDQEEKKAIAAAQALIENDTKSVPVPVQVTQPQPKPEWQPDASAPACNHCGVAFSLFTRRHHCRKCGQIFCSDCSNHEIAMKNKDILTKNTTAKEPEQCCTLLGSKADVIRPSTIVRVCNDCAKVTEELESRSHHEAAIDIVNSKSDARQVKRLLNQTMKKLETYQDDQFPPEWTSLENGRCPPHQVKLIRDLLGKGCVAKNHSCNHSRGFSSIDWKVDVIQNQQIWDKYQGMRKSMPPAETVLGERDLIGALSNFDKEFKVRPEINEAFFFHGTTLLGAIYIRESGFLPALSKAGRAMYGAGSYFSREACKVLDYAPIITLADYDAMCKEFPELYKSGKLPKKKDVVGKRAVIISRVLLGEPNIVKETNRHLQESRLPPVKSGAVRYGSNLARTGKMKGHYHGHQAHGEFIIFNDNQACPMYLMWLNP